MGKIHMAVGIAAILAVMQPECLLEFVLAAGGGTLGAVISDIDVGSSGGYAVMRAGS